VEHRSQSVPRAALRAEASATPIAPRSRRGARIGVALALGLAILPGVTTSANAECRPPAYASDAIRDAVSVNMIRLGPIDDHVVDPFGADSTRFLGYRRLATFRLQPDAVAALRRVLANGSLSCDAAGGGAAPRADYAVGFDLAGGSGAVKVAVIVPAGDVELELPNGLRFATGLTPAGLAAWRRFVGVTAARVHRTPEEFDHDMAADAHRPGVAARPDSSARRPAGTGLHPESFDDPAMAIVKVPPRYPDIAREAGVMGTVGLRALVGIDGRVHDVRIVKSIPMLDAAAVDAVRQWSFRPARRSGRAVDAWCEVPLRFSLH